MYQLKQEVGPVWVEPVSGLRILMDPVSSPVIVDMRLILSELLRELDMEIEAADEDGAVDAAAEDPAADDAQPRRAGRVTFTMVCAIVAAGAQKWEGFGDEAGTALPHPEPMQVYRLLKQSPAIFDFFDKGYANDVFVLLSEKNGSSPSPNGSSVREADPTAGTVVAVDTAAGTGSPVPTTSTRPEPAKDAGSGTSSTAAPGN